ncbi:MAG: hypothetical protein DLM60_02810 [Pseudonocardiales bacterium]|nr:MAG: hypothetical protein DLM60_02810 [Pseudonocardiales bacterium]
MGLCGLLADLLFVAVFPTKREDCHRQVGSAGLDAGTGLRTTAAAVPPVMWALLGYRRDAVRTSL